MTLPLIVYRSLRQHALSSAVCILSLALASGLSLAVWLVKSQSQEVFTGMTGGFDAVLGARGAKLQLVLNAMFHVEESAGNISWSDYQALRDDPNVELAIPLAVGDNYRGYRLVGTVPELLAKSEPAPGRLFSVRPPGRFFEPDLREAVVGDYVARRLGLRLGDRFRPYHGLIYDEQNSHGEEYLVVGLLEPSNTPADRVIWIPLEGIQKMSGHDPKAAEDLSAVLVRLKSGSANAGFLLDLKYNKEGTRLTFAWPIGRVVAQLFDKLTWMDRVLALVAYLVALVAAGSVLTSIYGSMNERRRELAILRALGAHRRTLFGAVLLEATTIAALGSLLGFACAAAILLVVSRVIQEQVGVVLAVVQWHPVMAWVPLEMLALGALAGLVPAWKAYQTDVADNLAPHS